MKLKNIVLKSVVLSTVVFSLASCGNTSLSPEDALLENQVSIVDNFKDLGLNIKLGQLKSDISVAFKNELGEGDGEMNLDFTYDNDKILSSGTIDISGNFSDDKESGSSNVALKIKTTKERIYAQLNDLGISIGGSEDSEEAKALKMMASAYMGKWLHMDLPKEILDQYNNTDSKVLQQFSVLMESLNKHRVLKVIKENENKDYYDLDVEFDKDNIVKIVKEVNAKINEGKEINEEEIRNSIYNESFTTNIKIDRKNTSYFMLTLSSKGNTLVLENTKSNLILTINEASEVTKIDLIKSGSKLSGTINSSDGTEVYIDGTLDIELLKNKLNFAGKFSLPDGGELSIDTKTSIKEISSFEFKEPTESIDFQQVMMGMMMGGGL